MSRAAHAAEDGEPAAAQPEEPVYRAEIPPVAQPVTAGEPVSQPRACSPAVPRALPTAGRS